MRTQLRLYGSIAVCAAALSLCVTGCRTNDAGTKIAERPTSLRPEGGPVGESVHSSAATTLIDLSEPGNVVWSSTPMEIIDTAAFDPQVLEYEPGSRPQRRAKEILPAHTRHVSREIGPPNDLQAGGLFDATRAKPGSSFPAIGQTGWTPPDPTLAAGPTHIVTTVNQAIAFYTRDGEREFFNDLNNAGNPGFFETVGSAGFTFDPKCFYDHYAERFVVMAPETYDNDEAWIAIAVSDDSNPNGVWYKYRTDAVITVGDTTYWWDYPGFGYDADAYYVTGNLYGLNQDGWGGVGFRIFDKASMLNGGSVQFATLRDGGGGSVQIAQHFGDNPAPYYVSVANNSQLRIQAIVDPLGSPQIVTTTTAVPSFNWPFDAPSAGASDVQLIDARMMNVHWRDGNLYAAHHVSHGDRNFARWYHIDTGDWPGSGDVELVQSGEIDAGGEVHTWFPAIYSNQDDNVALVFGTSSASQRIKINATGRLAGDPPGMMGAIETLQSTTVNGGGRWGDYYDIAVDPLDDETFWVIGEHPASSGWATWIGSFTISSTPAPHAVADEAGAVFNGEAVVLDVTGNDYHSGGLEIEIVDFDAASAQGGSVELLEGGGSEGRDALIYTPPLMYTGQDMFEYTIGDGDGLTSSATVNAQVYNAADFRTPDSAGIIQNGLEVAYYALSNPQNLPDFDALNAYGTGLAANVNYASTSEAFADSGREDEVGAVFEAYFSADTRDVYTFYLESDDGSRMYVGDELVVDNDGLHGMQERSGAIGLLVGQHRVRIEFFENGGGAGLIARVESSGAGKQVAPQELWYRPANCPCDRNGDGRVNLVDLAGLLGEYGRTGDATYRDGDFDGDRDVDLSDLAALLGYYGKTCE